MPEHHTENVVPRFEMVEKVRGMESWHELERDPQGDWVRFSDYDELREALLDIALGARMMLDSPAMHALHRYAREVLKVADAALKTPRPQMSPDGGKDIPL